MFSTMCFAFDHPSETIDMATITMFAPGSWRPLTWAQLQPGVRCTWMSISWRQPAWRQALRSSVLCWRSLDCVRIWQILSHSGPGSHRRCSMEMSTWRPRQVDILEVHPTPLHEETIFQVMSPWSCIFVWDEVFQMIVTIRTAYMLRSSPTLYQ